jgi:hypothetical protein
MIIGGAARLGRPDRHAPALDQDRADLGDAAQRPRDRVGLGPGVVEARSGRQVDDEQGAAGVLGRQEGGRQQERAADRGCEQHEPGQHGDDAVAHRPADQAGVGQEQPALALDVVGRRFQEIGRQHRGDQPRHDQRDEHRDRDRDAELLEELPGDAAHEARGDEHRDDRSP